jgi:hypothetical protein
MGILNFQQISNGIYALVFPLSSLLPGIPWIGKWGLYGLAALIPLKPCSLFMNISARLALN